MGHTFSGSWGYSYESSKVPPLWNLHFGRASKQKVSSRIIGSGELYKERYSKVRRQTEKVRGKGSWKGLWGKIASHCARVWRRHRVQLQSTEPVYANPFKGTSFDSRLPNRQKWGEQKSPERPAGVRSHGDVIQNDEKAIHGIPAGPGHDLA